MNIHVYRLPTEVNCSSNQGKVRISGPYGVVSFKSDSKIHRKGNMLIFLPYLTPYYSSIFTQGVLGVFLGYSIELSLKGIGYRVHKEYGKLIFNLGYSHLVSLTIPEDIVVKFDKKTFSLISSNYGTLQNYATKIRSYRFPNPYKGGGVIYTNEVLVCKEGKKN